MYLNKIYTLSNKKIMFFSLVIISLLSLFSSNTVSSAQENQNTVFFEDKGLYMDSIEYSINWTAFEIITQIHISWIPNSRTQYVNPSLALNFAEEKFPQIFSRLSQNIFLDSQTSLLDFTRDHSSYQLVLSQILNHSSFINQIPDKALNGTSITYFTPLSPIINQYIFPTYSYFAMPSIPSTQKNPTEYSSIIISVDSPIMSVQNNNDKSLYVPRIIPRIYSHDMDTLIYTPEYFDITNSTYSRPYTYIHQEDYQFESTGSNPLFITPLYIKSDEQGDLILSQKDTEVMLSSDSVKSLITEGKIFFIITKTQTRRFN